MYHGDGDSTAAQLALLGGSLPKELYNDILKEEISLLSKKLKPAFKSFMRENTTIQFADRGFDCFNATLTPVFKEYRENFNDYERKLLHEYYESRLKQREREREMETQRVRDEVQYRLKKKMWADQSAKSADEFSLKTVDYFETFERYVDEEGAKNMFTAEQRDEIVKEVHEYLSSKFEREKEKAARGDDEKSEKKHR